MNNEYGAIYVMRIGRRNRSTRRKPTPFSFCVQEISPQLPTTAARVRSEANNPAFVVDKVAIRGLSNSTSVFPANSHSTNFSTLINNPVIDATWSDTERVVE
jgi:hypothetical protein